MGNRHQIALTQVTPSAQEVIKAGFNAGHLRSSTITGLHRRYSAATPEGGTAKKNIQTSTLARSTEIPGPIVDDTVNFFT